MAPGLEIDIASPGVTTGDIAMSGRDFRPELIMKLVGGIAPDYIVGQRGCQEQDQTEETDQAEHARHNDGSQSNRTMVK